TTPTWLPGGQSVAKVVALRVKSARLQVGIPCGLPTKPGGSSTDTSFIVSVVALIPPGVTILLMKKLVSAVAGCEPAWVAASPLDLRAAPSKLVMWKAAEACEATKSVAAKTRIKPALSRFALRLPRVMVWSSGCAWRFGGSGAGECVYEAA